jgi:protein SCO1/2
MTPARLNIHPAVLPAVILAAVLSMAARPADVPVAGVKDAAVNERLGQKVPLDIVLQDETGQNVTLGDLLAGGRPVILQPGYFRCPMLCGLIAQGMVEAMKQIDLELGRDYDVLSVSIDPAETSQLAALKKQSYLEALGRSANQPGLRLLVGDEHNTRRLADAVGFEFKWIESAGQFTHPAVLIVLTPDGRISRYLYGVRFAPKTVRLSLVEASQNRIGTTMDQVLLVCFQYDGTTGQYALAAMRLMRAAGLITVGGLALVLGRLFLLEHRRRLATGANSEDTGT